MYICICIYICIYMYFYICICIYTYLCIELHGLSPKVQSNIISLYDYEIKTVSLSFSLYLVAALMVTSSVISKSLVPASNSLGCLSPRVQSYIISLYDYEIRTVALFLSVSTWLQCSLSYLQSSESPPARSSTLNRRRCVPHSGP